MARRPGIWKLNISLLSDDKYVDEINQYWVILCGHHLGFRRKGGRGGFLGMKF